MEVEKDTYILVFLIRSCDSSCFWSAKQTVCIALAPLLRTLGTRCYAQLHTVCFAGLNLLGSCHSRFLLLWTLRTRCCARNRATGFQVESARVLSLTVSVAADARDAVEYIVPGK